MHIQDASHCLPVVLNDLPVHSHLLARIHYQPPVQAAAVLVQVDKPDYDAVTSAKVQVVVPALAIQQPENSAV